MRPRAGTNVVQAAAASNSTVQECGPAQQGLLVSVLYNQQLNILQNHLEECDRDC